MQNLRFLPPLLCIAAFKIQNENKVWGAGSSNWKKYSIKCADLSKGQGALIDSQGSLIQFNLPMVSMSPPHTDSVPDANQEYKTILNANLIDVACSNSLVFSLSKNGTIFKTLKGQQEPVNNTIYDWFWPKNTIKCDALAWGEKIVQIDAGDDFVIARSNKGY